MTARFLDRPSGRISYDDSGGDGPLVIAAPGMGDSRKVYRHIGPGTHHGAPTSGHDGPEGDRGVNGRLGRLLRRGSGV
jgi:hypothetical protein